MYLETNWEIVQFRVSPAPDQSPASEVRLRKSGFGSPVLNLGTEPKIMSILQIIRELLPV